jgi:hypothetical protein
LESFSPSASQVQLLLWERFELYLDSFICLKHLGELKTNKSLLSVKKEQEDMI